MPQFDEGIKLSPKQRKFCEEYLICKNATEAAIKAGYSENSARFIGSENLTKPNIISYIQTLLTQSKNESIASLQEVMEFYTSVMRNTVEDSSATIAERLKAANSLHDRLSLAESKEDEDDDEGGVIILPEVKIRE